MGVKESAVQKVQFRIFLVVCKHTGSGGES
jgi:hypothetical protein